MRPVPALVALALALPSALVAQRRTGADAPLAAGAYDPALYSDGSLTSHNFKALRWRNIGPFRGGRSDAVAGDPSRPLVYYFGAVNGGIWKTTNAGQSWDNITDGRSDISSVGAIAVASSDPNVIYAGSGESQLREDLTYGTGMYRSTDAGLTWHHLGLTGTQQIGAVRIDPRDPDRVYVAALGHAFGPNAERGVYRTTDGGRTWRKILFLNDSTGANDISIDPSNPRILFASMYKFQRSPWGMQAGGGRSGLWKSTDGGDSWTEITANAGMPKGPIGKIGVAVSPANPRRIYASVEAKDTSGGIFRSDDGGDSWLRINGDQKFQIRPFYYSAVTADPSNENTVYVMNLQVSRSIDGGKTFTTVRVPHGDTHVMWVDPKDPNRLINGNDGGATVSQDGGKSWSSIMNQPTAQFYHVVTDDQWPYRVYGAQQDNSTVSITSRSDNGTIGERDWWRVAGCENAHIAVDPRNPDVTYGGCYTGNLGRHDKRTGQNRDISVWLNNYDGIAAKDVPNRFQWTFPVLLSPHDPRTLYVASQNVWRSTDEGSSWSRISPDLSWADTTTLGRSGGDVHGDMTGTEWYATIYALAESPTRKGLLWAGSDDGLIHVSRDDGKTWKDVTPKDMAIYTRVSLIEPSRYNAGTAYVAANRFQLDDMKPYLWKTSDFGSTWTRINAGIDETEFTRVIREDDERQGHLYVGTERGVWFSHDDGSSWQRLQLNLPPVPVHDLALKEGDLIAATHGRSFWVIDDISALRQMTPTVTAEEAHLFKPRDAYRVSFGGGRGAGGGGGAAVAGPPVHPVAASPTGGPVVSYWLKRPSREVVLEFMDAKGKLIRSFTSRQDSAAAADSVTRAARSRTRVDSLVKTGVAKDSAERLVGRAAPAGDSVPAFDEDGPIRTPRPPRVPNKAGVNAFNWNMRYPDASTFEGLIMWAGGTQGPTAPPGTYQVRMLVDGKPVGTETFALKKDPRSRATAADLAAQFAFLINVRDRTTAANDAVKTVRWVKSQLDDREKRLTGQAKTDFQAQAAVLRAELSVVEDSVYQTKNRSGQDPLNYPIRLNNKIAALAGVAGSADAAPTQQTTDVYTGLSKQLDGELTKMKKTLDTRLPSINVLLRKATLPEIVPRPADVPAPPGTISDDAE